MEPREVIKEQFSKCFVHRVHQTVASLRSVAVSVSFRKQPHMRVTTREGIQSFWRLTHAHSHTLGRACFETPGLSSLEMSFSLFNVPYTLFICTTEHTHLSLPNGAWPCTAWCHNGDMLWMAACWQRVYVHKFDARIFSIPFNVFSPI